MRVAVAVNVGVSVEISSLGGGVPVEVRVGVGVGVAVSSGVGEGVGTSTALQSARNLLKVLDPEIWRDLIRVPLKMLVLRYGPPMRSRLKALAG